MKFFMTMVGFIVVVLIAFYVGYKVELAPVEEGSAPSDYGVGTPSQESYGGIRTGGSSGSSSGFGTQKSNSLSAPRKCLEGARC